MISSNQLIENLNEVSNAKYIKKDIKASIKNELEIVKEHVNDTEEK